jgi:hypothetical protein
VLDLSTLAVANVDPWVPMVPGVPVTSISRQGDHVRAFSPGRTRYVLAAAGTDYSRADGGQAYGLLVVDIKSGIATELRMDRRRFRFAEMDDLDAAWIDHHFMWQLDPAGRERLVPRQRFATWPWRAKLESEGAGRWALRIQRIDVAFVPVLRRVLQREPGLQMAGPPAQPDIGMDFSFGGCALQAQAFGVGSSTASNHHISIWPAVDTAAGNTVGCEPALRRLAALIDAELATGKHDALLKFD